MLRRNAQGAQTPGGSRRSRYIKQENNLQKNRVERSTRSSNRLPAPLGFGVRFCQTERTLLERENDLFRPETQGFCHVPAEFRASRNPLLFQRFDGSFLLRLADRASAESLFPLPPRTTRFEPLRIIHRRLL